MDRLQRGSTLCGRTLALHNAVARVFGWIAAGFIASAFDGIAPKVGAARSALRWEQPLADFKARLATGEDVLGDLLDRFLLRNNHRVTVVTLPDSQLAKQLEAREKERVQTARDQMSSEEARCRCLCLSLCQPAPPLQHCGKDR